MSVLTSWKTVFSLCVFCATTAIMSPAQTGCSVAAPCFKSVSFNGADGANPFQVLVQGTDGNLYGLTGGAGAHGAGTVFVFKLNSTGTGGTLTTLYNFCSETNCTDGELAPLPGGGLMLATDGNFYGTTQLGGVNSNCNGGQQSCGTIFKITPAGTLTTLHSFSASEGSFPNGLVQGTDGKFYGTTQEGGANGYGTAFVFKVNSTGDGGTLKMLYNFCSQTNCTDGGSPSAGLIQATDGNFYGTTWAVGTVFKITPQGKLTTLATVGGYPSDALVQAADGNFYGTTARGGTIFKMTPDGQLTTLVTDCCYLYAGLVQGTDRNFYGTTYVGGANGYGTAFVFKLNSAGNGGTLKTLHNFCSQTSCTDGGSPLAGLMQGTKGNLYGVTDARGTYGFGTVFSLSVGMGPFVETLPTSGKVGTTVIILGNNLKGSTSVTLNGKSATFTVNSTGTAITTIVPSGATTGKVRVVTPLRTLLSNVNFRVTPTISSFSPTSGPPGTSVVISGESFIGATSVTFGAVNATFTVNSYTEITATVPSGAKTGNITVTTPGGTAISSGRFTVT